MRVYKFSSSEFGLKALREHRLKMSEIEDLNDPFELLPFDLSNPKLRQALVATRTEMNRKHGLVCFSRKWSDPVLWSHYSENHRGICLGFDASDQLTHMVDYVQDRLQFPNDSPTAVNQMLYTKYSAWAYEEEVRIWVNRGDPYDDGISYAPINNEDISLREVILGARCSAERSLIEEAIKGYEPPVRIIKARLSWSSFEVIEEEDAAGAGG
jgi:hypothetical protein